MPKPIDNPWLATFPLDKVRPRKPPGVVSLSGGGERRVEAARAELVDALRRQAPRVEIRVSDWTDEDLEDLGALAVDGAWRTVAIAPEVATSQILNRLSHGAWMMAFWESGRREHRGGWPRTMPKRDEEIYATFRDLGASAFIFSWYDDLEWVLALDPQLGPPGKVKAEPAESVLDPGSAPEKGGAHGAS